LSARDDSDCYSQQSTLKLKEKIISPRTLQIVRLTSHTKKNGFVTATKLGTANIFFVAATKNFAAATKRFVDRTKHFVVLFVAGESILLNCMNVR